MDKMQWGDKVMLLFFNGNSDGDGGSSCGGKKKISSRGVDNKCSKDENVLTPVPSPRPVEKKISSRGVDNKRSKDGNVLPPVPSPCPVKKKITSRGVDNNRSKDGNVLAPVPSLRPCNSENPCIMETRVYSRKKNKLTDQISRLPDELLVSILSRLSLKEAAASSILSRRWRFLWTFISKLDFEGSDMWTSFTTKPDFDLHGYPSDSKGEASIRECWEYVGWVDDVLGLRNKSAAIEEFRISFSLNHAHQSHIDRWIRFALAKKVVRLDLNLVQTCSTKHYTFSYSLLCGKESHSCGFKDLRLLRMVSVRISDGALEIFLGSCPHLEEIFFARCGGLSTVKIVNPLPALKRLTLLYCYSLESVEICDSNLVYFMLRAQWPLKHFVLKNVPLLVEFGVNVGGPVAEEVEEFVAMFSSCLPQLEKLTLQKRGLLSIMEADMICSSVKMSNLKQLVWKFMGFYSGETDLEGVAILVGALPLLERLVLMSHGDALKGCVDHFYNWKMSYRRTHAYSRLKQVEFVGYHGDLGELAILVHFFENAAGLEEVIVHPAKGTWFDGVIGEYTEQETDTFRSFAKAQLTTRVPSTVTLKVL